MVCPRCHETNTNLSRFCKKCGAVLLTQAELKKKEMNIALTQEVQMKREKEEAARKTQAQSSTQASTQAQATTQAEPKETPIQRAINNANASKAPQQLKFEYDVVTVPNKTNGSTDVKAIKKILAQKAADGWRLVSTYSNELGHISTAGTNSTICEDVLYFEKLTR